MTPVIISNNTLICVHNRFGIISIQLVNEGVACVMPYFFGGKFENCGDRFRKTVLTGDTADSVRGSRRNCFVLYPESLKC
jgi:hypothetical protein